VVHLVDEDDAGTLAASANFQTRSVTASTPFCALTRTTAASTGAGGAGFMGEHVEAWVSTRLILTPCHSAKATAFCMVTPRATSSSS